MDAEVRLALVPRGQCSDWSRDSLEQGSRLATQVATRIDTDRVQAYAIVPQGQSRVDVSKFSQSARIGGADRFLGRVLRELSTRADGILVVDDDLARRGDPGLDRASFIDDRVIRWGDLHSEPRDLTGLIRTGASGYPLNAFVCGSGDRQAFRPPVGPLSESEVALLARQVQVVIHSIYDAESFLLLAIDDKADSLLASLTRTQAEFGEVDENRVSGSPGI